MQTNKHSKDNTLCKKDADCVLLLVPDKLWDYTDRDYVLYKGYQLKYLYILDIISNMLSKLHMQKQVEVCLSSAFLRKKYGTRYNYYIDYLTDGTEDNSYLVKVKPHISGIRSTSYRLNEIFAKSHYKHFKCYDKIFVKKCVKIKEFVNEKHIKKSSIPEHIIKVLTDDLYSVTLDIDAAKKYLAGLLQTGEIDQAKYNANMNTIEEIATGNRYTKFDDYGRMHTNFTILKKEIREKFLRIDGHNVVELDIRNSQPSMLISILKENLHKLDKKEYDRYVKLCLSGTLYQQLHSHCVTKNSRLTVKDAKNMVFRVLFGKNSTNTIGNKCFHFCFPTIFNFLKEYKQNAGGHKFLAHELQRRESLLIFNKIVKECKEKYIGIKMFTVHDSILYPTYFKKQVEEIFNRVLQEEFKDLDTQFE